MDGHRATDHIIFARRTGMIAHRGVHTDAPENTVPAMELAAERGFEMVEMDVQLTADGEYVIIHDATVDRTTDGTGRVDELTLSQLQRLAVKGAPAEPVRRSVRVPTMEEAFATCGSLGLGVNVDCSKILWDEKVIADVARALQRHGLWERSFFVNGDRRSRHLMARMYPDVAVTWLSSDADPRANIDEVRRFRHAFVTYSHRHLTDELFRTYADEGIPVFVYQCNDVEVVRRWRDRGARFIETDTVMPWEV